MLEITGQIIVVPPYFENFGKRLVKSPKVYIGDSGLACHLLGIEDAAQLDRSPFLGALFEGFVAAEILKSQVNRGLRKELYYFRDQQGLEVDFIVPTPSSGIWMVECKASRTVEPSMARPMEALRRAIKSPRSMRMTIVHRDSRSLPAMRAIAPNIEAMGLRAFVETLNVSSRV